MNSNTKPLFEVVKNDAPGRFTLRVRSDADRHPTVVWELDQKIRRWRAESARSTLLIYRFR